MSIALKDVISIIHQADEFEEKLANSGLQYEITRVFGQPSPRSTLKASEKIGWLVGIETRFPNSVCLMSDTAAKATDAYVEEVMKADKDDVIGVAITGVGSNEKKVLKRVNSSTIMAEVFGIFIAPKKDFGVNRLVDGLEFNSRAESFALEYFTEQMKAHEAWLNNDIYNIKVWPKNSNNDGCFAIAEAVYLNDDAITSAMSKCIDTVQKQMSDNETLTTLTVTLKKDISRSHLSASDLLLQRMKAKYNIDFTFIDEQWDESNKKLTISYLPSCLPAFHEIEGAVFDDIDLYKSIQEHMEIMMVVYEKLHGKTFPMSKWEIAKQIWSGDSCSDWHIDVLNGLMKALITNMKEFKFVEQTQQNISENK